MGTALELVRGEHGLDVLHRIAHLQTDMVPRTDAAFRERVSELIRPRVELLIGAPDGGRHDCLALGYDIDDALEQLRQVEGHKPMVDGLHGPVKGRRTHRADGWSWCIVDEEWTVATARTAGSGRLVTRRSSARLGRSSSVSRRTSVPKCGGSSGFRRVDRSWS